jgi:hypothetical protein
MMIRGKVQFFRFWHDVARVGSSALFCALCALACSAGGAIAVPYAQPGLGVPSLQSDAARPVIRAGLCGEGRDPCPAYEPSPYAAAPDRARRWQPAPEPYPVEHTVVEAKPDCAEARYAAHPYTAYDASIFHRPRVTYEEPCGIKCWYQRLRAGYCGRGCDYYRFRMTQFPEGRLGDEVQVACR